MTQTAPGQRNAIRIHGPVNALLLEFVHMDRYGTATNANVCLANTASALMDITSTTVFVVARDSIVLQLQFLKRRLQQSLDCHTNTRMLELLTTLYSMHTQL